MVYPPQHHKDVFAPRKRTYRERWIIGTTLAVVAVLAVITVISFTAKEGHSGNGCLKFSYAMAMGGEQLDECGHAAKKLCATPPKLGGLANGLLDKLPAECRKAGLPYKTGA